MQSERNIAARRKALEESRQIPRNFALYVPPQVAEAGRRAPPIPPRVVTGDRNKATNERIIWTTSLPLVLGKVEAAMKRPSRPRRPRGRSRGPSTWSDGSTPAEYFEGQEFAHTFATSGVNSATFRKLKKGKQRDPHASLKRAEPPTECDPLSLDATHVLPKAWFLDVASPTWEDLRALGKLLHLHPLTLEDILQQEPREKLELFPKLGYYFVSFRAIESKETRDKIRQTAWKNSDNADDVDDEPIGEANVYLAVFKEGICCFHYTDISEHTDRVRNRIVLLEDAINMSSDWIAHGILDSIVDAFFPFLADIEREVTDVDALVYSGPDLVATVKVADAPLPFIVEKQIEDTSFSEKAQRSDDHVNLTQNGLNTIGVEFSQPRFVLPRPSVSLVFRQLRRFMVTTASLIWRKKMGYRANATTTTLRRMTRTRRLVTSLSRLLATKADVVTHIQKRLMRAGHSGLGNGTSKGEEFEVAIYMGDVQDHILTLQHSLVHIERILSQSHLSYLVQLRSTAATTKGGQDTAVMTLSVVTLGVVCVQTLIGVCSMNVTLPANLREPGAPFNVFGVVIAMSFIILIVYSWLVRWWWIQARGPRQDLR